LTDKHEALFSFQQQLKVAVQQITEAIKKPFMAIKEALQTAMNIIKTIAQKMREMLTATKRAIFSIRKFH
jgi:hypothetical protein